MKKSFIIKSFVSLLVLSVSAIQSFAADITNHLSKVIITKADDYTYSLNLVFQDNFKGRAFLQNKNNGQYIVFIPDAAKADNRIKINNKFKKMPKIKVAVDEKPYLKDDRETSYLKLDIKTEPDYSIKLVSVKEKPSISFFTVMKYIFNSVLALLLFVIIIASLLLLRRKKNNTYTVFPSQFVLQNNQNTINKNNKEPMSNPVISKKALQTADKDNFSCFDIPKDDSIVNKQNYQMQSSIKKTSVITNNLKNSSNPAGTSKLHISEDLSEFNMPFVNEIVNKENNQIPNPKTDVLSVLNITPTKGFFLKEEEGAFSLYGFVSEKSFLLKKFADLHRINLQARFYDQDSKSDIYIIKLDSYKAMIEISDMGMKELAVL